MTLENAVILARQGTKMTHTYFTDKEYITMKGNTVIFEDGIEIFLEEWKDKDYFKEGWSEFKN
jgi:hypothetical protein